MKLLIVCLCFATLCWGYKDVFVRKNSGSGVPQGSPMSQRITTSLNHVNFLFWWEDKNLLIMTDSGNSTQVTWNYTSGEMLYKPIPKTEVDEPIGFIMPVSKTVGILGAGRHLHLLNYSSDGRQIQDVSSPVITFTEDDDYKVNKAHCDGNGNMYIILNTKCKRNGVSAGKGELYFVKDRKAKKVLEVDTAIQDFVFNKDFNKMYLICDTGLSIYEFDVDTDNGKISNKKLVFEMGAQGFPVSLESIDMDKKGNLWVVGQKFLYQINSEFEIVDTMPLASNFQHALTFGGYKNKNIFLGNQRSCNIKDVHSGSTLAISGFDAQGYPDINPKW